MLHPVGSQPPSVYWRRRLLVLASTAFLLVLIVLTLKAVLSSDNTPLASGGTSSASPTPTRSQSSSTPTSSPKASASSSPSSSSGPSSRRASSSPTVVTPPRCRTGDLAVAARTGAKSYKVGDKPTVELEVINTGSSPCVQDLADRQVELRVYNGESRVWGSHDCNVQSGTTDRVLAVGRAVRVSVTWSGLTSRAKCVGTRQRVGAGTYTLYASLSGKTGRATQFSIA